MSSHGGTLYDNFFSSLISDIKAYEGTDPLLPWIRGIKKMKDSLPPQLVKEKLPRFLQKLLTDEDMAASSSSSSSGLMKEDRASSLPENRGVQPRENRAARIKSSDSENKSHPHDPG